MELFECIRYYYISHQDLVRLMSNDIFTPAKNLIAQGLSLKLNERVNPSIEVNK